jgi:hypothetical protein
MKRLMTVTAICALVCVQAHATISAEYTFTGRSGASSDTNAVSTAGNFTLHGYGPGTKIENGDVFFLGGPADIKLANESTAIKRGRYASFTLTAKPGYVLNLAGEALTFQIKSSKSGKPVYWAVTSSVGGSSVNIATGSTSSTAFTSASVDFSGLQFDNLSSITLTFYLWNGDNDASAIMSTVQLLDSVVAASDFRILSLTPTSDRRISIDCLGTAGASYQIQATSDLAAAVWTTISTNQAGTNGLFQFVDSDAANYPCRFYRISTP